MAKTNVVQNKVRRTVQATSKFELNKCHKALSFSKDPINKLPDEILVSILSLLTMKEAARTAVLSHRWRNLWTYAPSLNLDFVDTGFKGVKSPLDARDGFVDWVNQVLKVHQGSRLDKFRVTFDVDDKSFKCDVDNWINYALVRRVKRLELNFSCYWPRFVRGNYTLTIPFLRKYSLVSLIELRLNSLDVTGEVLDYFLSTCPFLEVLSVQIVTSLVNLRVSGVSLMLKYLEISQCQHLENIEISATNLTSFKYFGPKVSMHLKDVPHLVDASFGGSFACSIINNMYHLSSYLLQLERLTLNLGVEIFENFPKFPKLRNLKHLVLLLNASVGIFRCPSLLNATPSLHQFTLKFPWLRTDKRRSMTQKDIRRKMKQLKAKRPHQCLKVLELVGFAGYPLDFKLVLYLLNKAVSLEKIVIDPRCPHASDWLDGDYDEWLDGDHDEKLTARAHARRLETVLPRGVELVIL